MNESVRWVTVDADEAGQRIDNFLNRLLKGVPRSAVYRCLRTGQVRVNGGRVRAGYRVQPGDRVRIPPLRTASGTAEGGHATPGPSLDHTVLYEDDRVLVLNKPAGLAVHGGSGLVGGLIERLRGHRPDCRFLELAHRLDRDTSGCLVIAKRRSELRRLHALLRNGGVEKHYLTLLCGDLTGTRVVDAPLQRNIKQGGERMVQVRQDGRAARTVFEAQTHYGGSTFVRVSLGTGRTHQIRVHAAHIGHPIAGDDKYGDPECNRRLRNAGLRRLFLHASHVAFAAADGGGKVTVTAPLPPDLRQVLDGSASETPGVPGFDMITGSALR